MKYYVPVSAVETALRSHSSEWRALIRARTEPLALVPTTTTKHLTPRPGIRAVIFDIYGTLLISGSGEVGSATDNYSDHKKPLSFTHAFQSVGVKPSDSDEKFNELCTKLYIDTIKARHAELLQAGVDHPEVDILEIWQSIWQRLDETRESELNGYTLVKLALEYELTANPTWLMPNVHRSLEHLSRSGYRLGIVSNAQFYTPLILETLLGSSLAEAGFSSDLLVWSYLLGRAKPSPRMFAPLVETLKSTYRIDPSEVLYVGNDMLNDIYTASASGCKTALFAGDRRSLRLRRENSLVQSLHSDAIITDISQLQQLLELSHVKE